MQRAESPSFALDDHIDKVSRQVSELTALVADRKKDAEDAARTKVPILQQKIDVKQKEIEKLEQKIQQWKQKQEAARQEMGSLNAQVNAATERSQRVAAILAGSATTTATPLKRLVSSAFSESSRDAASRKKQKGTGETVSGVGTSASGASNGQYRLSNWTSVAC